MSLCSFNREVLRPVRRSPGLMVRPANSSGLMTVVSVYRYDFILTLSLLIQTCCTIEAIFLFLFAEMAILYFHKVLPGYWRREKVVYL